MYLKNSQKLLQMISESHLRTARTSFFSLFSLHSLYLEGISLPWPMTPFLSVAVLGLPGTSLSIISICWLFIKLNNFFPSVFWNMNDNIIVSQFYYNCLITVPVVWLNLLKQAITNLHTKSITMIIFHPRR